MRYVGRLAPSPTGLLHLGHARTFSVAHARARAAGGMLWLREEDLDPQRSREEFSVAIKEDLCWLGLRWDAEAKQSDRLALYRSALEKLLRAGHVYACVCSRRDLQQSVQAPHEDTDDEPVYSGRCRPSGFAEDAPLHAGLNVNFQTNYRFRIATTEPVTFCDGNAGDQSFAPGIDFGDFVVWRKDGLPSYQMACVVDDAAMGVTEVVRGSDLLKSTARQILLQRALRVGTPDYFHCDLLRDTNGVRLAKRHDALSLRSLRGSGVTRSAVETILRAS